MKNPFRLTLSLMLAAGCATSPTRDERARAAQVFISEWPAPARAAAAKMIDEYGGPDVVLADSLAWEERGPWKRTEVRRDDLGLIEQTLAYPVWADMRRELHAAFPDTIAFPGRPGELTARSPSERLNFLTFNLADAVITNGMRPEEVRRLYDKTVELDASGKSSSYMQGLLFMPK